MSTLERRDFLKMSLTGAAATVLAGGAATEAFGRDKGSPIVATRLTDSIFLFSGAGANVVAARGPEGLVLVDGGQRERSKELLKTVFRQTGEDRVQTLFNTHWHPEHTGSNERLARTGTRIVAHENTRLWLSTRITTPWDNRT
jgi:glyoxylase-like metal-dependent hydrolase (beta-lactamase superfamily II)